MNIVKLQNELKGVPDDALIGYVQNPTGQVPTYLALSELQRRKEMRNSYQAAKPETTVAESLVNEAQPQPMQQGIAAMAPQQMEAPQPAPMPQDPMAPPQGMAGGGMVSFADGGLAGLDTGNMYDEQIYAQGGIVAFADGGETGSNYLDSQAPLNLNTGMQSSDKSQDLANSYVRPESKYALPSAFTIAEYMGRGVGGGPLTTEINNSSGLNYAFPYFNREFAESAMDGSKSTTNSPGLNYAFPYFNREIKGYADGGEVKGFAGPDGSDVQADTPTSRIDTMYKLLSGAPYKFYRGLAESTANVPYEAARSQFPGLPENIFQKNVLGGEPGAGLFGTSTPREYPSGDKIPGANIAPTADTITGAKPATESTKPAVADDPFAALKKTLAAGPTEKPKSMQDYAAEYKQALGEDPTVQGAKDRLAKMEARAADREEKSGWMALAKAGLTMAAGKSPRAIQNIAEGATAGVNDYVSAQEKLDTLREKHFELQSQLDRQARAEQVSATTYGANSKERAEDRAAREKLEKMSLGNQLAIAQLNYGLNTQNKLVANRDKAIDNAMQKAKIIAEQKGVSDATEFDAIYQPLLAQELASLGVTGTGSTYKPPVSGMLQTTKDGVLNYVRNATK
jgi:hypothetical protein